MKLVQSARIHLLKNVQNVKTHIPTRILILDCVLQHAQAVGISTRKQSPVEDLVQVKGIILKTLNVSSVILRV